MSVTAANGFAAGAVHAGIRKKDKLDLALVHSLVPATGAGMFTVNRVQAAPVTVSRKHLELAQPQAIVANSGVANAATGAEGIAAACATAAATAAKLGIEPEQVLVLSTGVIGQQLPVDRVLAGIDALELGEDGGEAAAAVCGELAKQIVADGEGATVLAEIAVRGAANHGDARAIAERVATSPLVKTALYGHDANWGRIAAAAGSAKVDGGYAALDPDTLSIVIDGVPVLVHGVPSGDEPVLTNGHCAIEIDLALGTGVASYLTTDLSYDYVRINAEYRS